ncbi:PH domain-containing protein [Zhihengliuella halotolerans]|uniref:PH domain-containing protein n=1 Tax=Zhihengliuella halotolerans TaxID=370736 RepID=UPI000C800EF5|nr:PH domain-containing protein [Zhihengliuella halotolerans]
MSHDQPNANDGAVPVDSAPRSPQDFQEEAPWHRVHPVSPFVRGWIVIVALVYGFGQNWLQNLIPGFGGEGDGDSSKDEEVLDFIFGSVAWIVAGGLLVLLLILGGFFLSWKMTRYQLTDRHVNVRSGIVFRQQRQARIDRVQAIDIVQPLVARIFGLAELKFEVADGGSTAMKLAFLKLAAAKDLRAAILARAAGLRTQTAGGSPPRDATREDPEGTDGAHDVVQDAPVAPENVLVRVPPGRLLASIVLSPAVWIAVIILGVGLIVQLATDSGFLMVYLLPGLFGFVPWIWGLFNNGFNFAAGVSPDGLRLSYGLLDTRHQTVPPGRIQAVQIRQGIIWRLMGWHKIVVNVAGYGAGADGGETRSTVLPVGTRADVLNILSIVLPNPGTDRPLELVEAGIAGSGPAEGFTTTPRTARFISPLAWRRQGFTVTRTAVFSRHGFLNRYLDIVPHERTQGIRLVQGPLARAAAVCSVRLMTTDGPVSPYIVQAAGPVARRFFLEQSARAARARAEHDRNHWLDEDPYGTGLAQLPVAKQAVAAGAGGEAADSAPPLNAPAPPLNSEAETNPREKDDKHE